MTLAEITEVDVVFGIRNHVINIVDLALRRSLEWLPGLDLTSRDMHAVDAGEAVIRGQDFRVDLRTLRAHRVLFRGSDVLFGRRRPEFKGCRFAVEFDDRCLTHVSGPDVAPLVPP